MGAQKVEVFGNTKFDEASSPDTIDASEWKMKLGIPAGKKVIVIGSTRSEMEEQLVIQAFFSLSDVVFVHAPRHVETASRIVDCFKHSVGSTGKTIGLRSEGQTGDYIVLNSFGELGAVYSIADLVIIGGGFDTLGGQNLIQPLALGKPVIHGPNMFNFREVAAASVRAGSSVVVETSDALATTIRDLLSDEQKRQEMGHSAKELVAANVGASKRYAEAVIAEFKPLKR